MKFSYVAVFHLKYCPNYLNVHLVKIRAFLKGTHKQNVTWI